MLIATALEVRILDAQQETAGSMPCQQVIEQGRTGISQVQLAGGTRRKTRGVRGERPGLCRVHLLHEGMLREVAGPTKRTFLLPYGRLLESLAAGVTLETRCLNLRPLRSASCC